MELDSKVELGIKEDTKLALEAGDVCGANDEA